jgi:uncharacterized protein YfbU (UPF0304 family)
MPKLTDAERMILFNQFYIISILDPEDAEEYWYPCLKELYGDGTMWDDHGLPLKLSD